MIKPLMSFPIVILAIYLHTSSLSTLLVAPIIVLYVHMKFLL